MRENLRAFLTCGRPDKFDITDIVMLGGMVAIPIGFGLLAVWLGVVVGGVVAIVGGYWYALGAARIQEGK
jgi:hypothetical protein